MTLVYLQKNKKGSVRVPSTKGASLILKKPFPFSVNNIL